VRQIQPFFRGKARESSASDKVSKKSIFRPSGTRMNAGIVLISLIYNVLDPEMGTEHPMTSSGIKAFIPSRNLVFSLRSGRYRKVFFQMIHFHFISGTFLEL
jgi:hypothetical protein